MRRTNHHCLHTRAVRHLKPKRFRRIHIQLRQDRVILVRELPRRGAVAAGDAAGCTSIAICVDVVLVSLPARTSRNRPPSVIVAPTLSAATLKESSLKSGEKVISSGPPPRPGDQSELAPIFKSRSPPVPS